MKTVENLKRRYADFQALDARDKKTFWKEFALNNALYVLIIIAIIYTAIQNPNFVTPSSIVNIISLSAANIPIAVGIAGCIVLTGTDLSAGRVVGLTACIAASLLQAVDYPTKIFPDLGVVPIPLVILIVVAVGALVGLVNGFFVAHFKLHPFIVTLATQLIVYGFLLMYIMLNGNNGQPLSGLDQSFKDFVTGSIIKIGGVPIPNYVWYACFIIALMWFIWNKTTFGKNLYAVGGNPEAAAVSGISVFAVTLGAFVMAGILYGFGSWLECARMVGSGSAAYGQGWDMDAIAACVVGGVSFTGGIGKISGVVTGVCIFTALTYSLTILGIDTNLQFVFSGIIILVAVTLDCLKYVQKK